MTERPEWPRTRSPGAGVPSWQQVTPTGSPSTDVLFLPAIPCGYPSFSAQWLHPLGPTALDNPSLLLA